MVELTKDTAGTARETLGPELAEQALAAGFSAFRDAVCGQSDLAYRTDSQDALEWISPEGARLLGYDDPEALRGRPAAEVLYRRPDDRAPLLAALSGHDGPVFQEEILCRADGSTLAVRVRAMPRRDAKGREGGMEGHALVLSGETEARLTLARALREMETIFDNALIGMMLVREGRIEKINARGAAVFGYPAAQLVGAAAAFLFPSPEAYAAFMATSNRELAATGTLVCEIRLQRKNGRPFIVRNYAKRIGQRDLTEGVIWAFEDVTEQKRLEEELRASKQAAEAANTAKTQFLANMSHELRTPLNGIIGMTQLLLDTAGNSEMREYLGAIRQSAATLMHIVGDLLDLSSVEAGRLVVLEREFDPKAEFLPLLRNFSSQSQLRAFEFSYQFDPLLPARLIGDPDRTKQILINLIGNAFKYTQKGSVTVRLGLGDALDRGAVSQPARIRLHVTVADTGVGIEPSRHGAIFEPFGIGEEYLTKRYSGAGLGLAIARRLANMMGGDITLDSEPGRGSTFYLTVEYGLPQTTNGGKTSRPKPSEPQSGQDRTLRILLAEDEPVNRIFTVRALQKLGHTVETAEDGREALTVLGRAPFDLVLMDIQMPRLNGLDATRLIRSGQVPGVDAAIPVVALTAYAMDSDRERGIEAGMDEYVTKPFEAAELVAAMERALRKETASSGRGVSACR